MTGFESICMWQSVSESLRKSPPGTHLAYAKTALPHPRQAGARISIGLPAGQIADYRFGPDKFCSGLHVQEYNDRWVAHIDKVHPDCGPVRHISQDAPAAWCMGGAVLGASIGAALGRKGGLIIAGAGIGFLVAIIAREILKQGS